MDRVKIGDKFGYWVVVGDSIFKGNHIRHWLCQCTCGKESYVGQYFLLNNKSRSCGCTRDVSDGTKKLLSKLRRSRETQPVPVGTRKTQEQKDKISAGQKARHAAKRAQALLASVEPQSASGSPASH